LFFSLFVFLWFFPLFSSVSFSFTCLNFHPFCCFSLFLPTAIYQRGIPFPFLTNLTHFIELGDHREFQTRQEKRRSEKKQKEAKRSEKKREKAKRSKKKQKEVSFKL